MADYSRPLSKYLKIGINVRCECRKCGHIAIFDPRGLARRYGTNIDPAYLPFRCYAPRALDGKRCLSRSIRVSPDWPSGSSPPASPPSPNGRILQL